jgi:hypothetical protein
MASQLNLALIHKRREEMNETEMNTVRAGMAACECGPECGNEPLHHSGFFEDAYYGDLSDECPCASVWVVFGLMWG